MQRHPILWPVGNIFQDIELAVIKLKEFPSQVKFTKTLQIPFLNVKEIKDNIFSNHSASDSNQNCSASTRLTQGKIWCLLEDISTKSLKMEALSKCQWCIRSLNISFLQTQIRCITIHILPSSFKLLNLYLQNHKSYWNRINRERVVTAVILRSSLTLKLSCLFLQNYNNHQYAIKLVK